MTAKEQLRKKFIDILPYTPEFTETLDALMAAVDELYKPVHITIKPTDEQLEKITKEFRESAYALWVYGDPTHRDNVGDEQC